MLAGTTAVEVGSGLFANPYLINEIVDSLKKYLQSNKIRLKDLVGNVRVKV